MSAHIRKSPPPGDAPAPDSPAAPRGRPRPTGASGAATANPATRKERQRADRHRAIIAAARELAESEGWDAVTTRRLAQRIEYSQPVLYSHFAGKEAILGAVALEGFAELTARLRAARAAAPSPDFVPGAVAGAYLDFALASPALFEAMFTLPNGLAFGVPESPEALVEAFAEVVAAFGPLAGAEDPETFVEMAFGALHGQTVLGMSGRLRPHVRAERLAMLVRLLKREPAPGTNGAAVTAESGREPAAVTPVRPDLRWTDGGRLTAIDLTTPDV